jgi:hypothetical protein
VDVEVRYVQGCPNLTVTSQRLALALDAVGRAGTAIRRRLVSTAEEAKELGFVGSPTVLIDGTDPFMKEGAAVGLSCRLYGAGGAISVAPSIEQLTAALAARLRAEQG